MLTISSKRLIVAVLAISFICVVMNHFRMMGYVGLTVMNMIAYATFFLNLAASIVGFLRTPQRVT